MTSFHHPEPYRQFQRRELSQPGVVESPTRPRQRAASYAARKPFISAFLASTLLLVALAFFLVAGAMLTYASIARELPLPEELVTRAASFASTEIYDRDGNLLNEVFDPESGRRTRVPLDRIAPVLIQATIATEDANFYEHGGVDPVSILRIVYHAVREREVIGASTIPQQLVKLTFLSPERTVLRKVKEGILASEISRRYPKDSILELYLNEITYGNLAVGIEAAAQTYFDKPASDLDLAEAALLAGLPQAPSYYDPYSNLWEPDGTPGPCKERQGDVLGLMVRNGYIKPAEADAAWLQPLRLTPPRYELLAPHFVMYVRQLLEAEYGPEMVHRAGLRVYTTLDSRLQELAQRAAKEHLDELKGRNVNNAALVAIQPQSGEILAMLGSVDFYDVSIDGQVNVTLRPRQPGSAIKPLTYLAAFEKQEDFWTPATLINDVRTEFPDGLNPPYVPVNYDGQDHGWVSVRTALASSYNIAAVKALEHVGLPALRDVASRLGISTLTRPDYGLSLTLGGGEVTLLELTGAYAAMANEGLRVPAVAIRQVKTSDGQLLAEHRPSAGERAVQPGYAYLITSILSDNEARTPAFGAQSALRLSRPAAAKTGTTNDFRDNWAVGYTPDLAAGVWVGNNNNAEMIGVTGISGAAPIWRAFMEGALAGKDVQEFRVPERIRIVEICEPTGAVPDSTCPPDRIRPEVFVEGRLPPGADREQYRVLVLQPSDGETVQGRVHVVGRVQIPDFDHYVVEYGESHAPQAWGQLGDVGREPVEAGLLVEWDTGTLSMEGPHVLRVVAIDRRGNRYESAIVRLFVIIPTPTPVPTATFTSTPAPTYTATSTPTDTPTPAPTATATADAVATGTPSPTTTLTVIVTPDLTATPEPTPTRTPGTDVTATPSLTPWDVSPTPTATAGVLAARIDVPQEGGTVSGQAQISGSAEGNAFAGHRVDFRSEPDGTVWQPIAGGSQPVTAGQLALWQTLNLPDGYYLLRLTVFESAGREVTNTVRVAVDNTPPVVQWVYPQEGAILAAGPVLLLAEASDNLGLAQVDFFVDAELVGSFAEPPFAVDWSAAPGRHDLRVDAVDRAGSSAIHVIGGIEVR
jgi:penicillin-binding protein 1C